MATKKKGFKAKKKPTKGDVQKENDALKQQQNQLSTLLMNTSRGVIQLRNDVGLLQREQQVIVELLRYQQVDKVAEKGDFIMVDFLGRFKNEDGTPGDLIDQAVGLGYTFKLGQGKFVPGFEDQLEGMKPGDTRQIEVTFPDNYADNLKGKKALFDIALLKVYGELENASIISDLYEGILEEQKKKEAEAKAKEPKAELKEVTEEPTEE